MMFKTNNFTNIFQSSFNRLGKSEKRLLFLLLIAVTGSLFFNRIFKPQFKQSAFLKAETLNRDNRIFDLQTEAQSLKEEKNILNELSQKNKQLKKNLSVMEKQLTESYQIPKLLGELVKISGDWKVDFLHIKPVDKVKLAQEDYSRFDIEMQFNAPYYDFIGYLSKLEALSSYINVRDIVVERPKDAAFAEETTATLLISTFLSKEFALVRTANQKRETSPVAEFFKHNPFLPQSSYQEKKPPQYVLSGITFADADSTVIINNEIYRAGDILDNKWVIAQILPNMVILEYGRASEALVLSEQ